MQTILLADDVETTLAVEKSFLESRDLKVFATTSASQALELAASLRPNLIIIDYEMPEMMGDEVCRRLGQMRATAAIPVMILSARHTPEMVQKCRDAGAIAVLRKTDGRESLLDQVIKVLGLPQRKHIRVPCSIVVGLKESDEEHHGLIHNLSRSGLYITLETALEVGKPLRIFFMIPDAGQVVDILGEIVRIETLSGSMRGYGVQILEANETSLTALRDFVERCD